MIKRLEHLSKEERLRELGLQPREEKAWGGGSYQHIWTLKPRVVKGTEPGSFQGHPVTGPEAVHTHQNTRGFVWTSGNISFAVRVTNYSHRVLREVVESPPLRVIEKPSEHRPGQPAVDGPAWEWDQMISTGPFQLQPFCNWYWGLNALGCNIWLEGTAAKGGDLPLKS